MAGKGKRVEAFGYMRTSSATNVGDGKESAAAARGHRGLRQGRGYEIAGWFYDPAVSGADPVTERPGFSDMLAASQATACARS